ncbi:MAG: hypothetical protein AAFU70_12485, partial [Planctomycetota bacterium]
MKPIELIALVHAFATLAMTGLIWMVQIVHYPLFETAARGGEQVWSAYERSHQSRITLIVGPLMLAEVVAAGLLLVMRPEVVPAWMLWVGAGLLAAAWLTTFLVSVPAHARLSGGFDARAHATLVNTNWIRTAAWTARGV